MAYIRSSISSPLSDRLHQNGLGQLISVNVASETAMYGNHQGSPYGTQIEYCISIRNASISDIHTFEDALLIDHEFVRMKRIVESNPELKELYEKYETLDALEGNQ